MQVAFHLRFRQSYETACWNFTDRSLYIANICPLLFGAQNSIKGTKITVHKRNDLLLKLVSYNQKYSAKLSKGDHNMLIQAQRGDGSVALTHLPTGSRKLWVVNNMPGKQTQYTFNRRLGGLRGRYRRKISLPPEFESWTFQLIMSRHTD